MMDKIWLFPVTVAILVPLTFVATYVMAVQLDHVEALFPYISDTGTIAPESCIFGQLMNISALLIGLCMYLRHRQIVEFHRHARLSHVWFLRTSTGFLWLGYVAAFGLSMVANFQESNWMSAHVLGALLAFGFGLIYIWAQTVFGFIMKKPLVSGCWITPVRLMLAIFATSFFTAMTASGFFRELETVDAKPMQPPFRLKPDHPSYRSHLTSTTCEWLMVFCFIVYFLTYAFELRHAVLKPPKLVLNIDDEKLPRDAVRPTHLAFEVIDVTLSTTNSERGESDFASNASNDSNRLLIKCNGMGSCMNSCMTSTSDIQTIATKLSCLEMSR